MTSQTMTACSEETGPKVGRDLAFLSLETWDDIWRPNQLFCAGYARRHPTANILYVTAGAISPTPCGVGKMLRS
jgi:hypothetical protein